MLFSFGKNVQFQDAEIASLQRQLESAKRRITELTLETIQQANEIATLREYRGVPEVPRPILTIGKEMAPPAVPANSEIGLLFERVG